MSFSIKKILKTIVISGVFLISLGFSQLALGADMNGQMINCPLMPGHSAVICKLNPLEHIQEWQKMFTILPVENFLYAVLLIFTFLLLRKFLTPSKISFLKNALLRKRHGSPNNFSFRTPTHLQLAFARGILNPKLF